MRIGIDLMGSDTAPKVLYEGVLWAAEKLKPADSFVVFATEKVIDDLSSHPLIDFHVVKQVIKMGEVPIRAIRRKKQASICVGVQALRDGDLDAFVSAGNTGALIASGFITLNSLPNILKPALLAVLPSKKDDFVVLDVGANVSLASESLLQFAQMGAIYQDCMYGRSMSRVGLLNIGSESMKGTEGMREAYSLLEKESGLSFEFIGNVEGNEAFEGKVDVLVTDGVSGNVFLKTAEGVSSFILQYLRGISGVSKEAFEQLERYVHTDQYPGAFVCGLDGLVVKCHGASSAWAMCSGILGAQRLVEANIISRMKEFLGRLYI